MCGKRLDLAGIQLGHLTVLEATDHRSSQGSIIWRCRCDCGNEIDVSYKALVYGNQQSCGCKKREHESELGTYLTHIDGTSIEALKSSKIPSNNTTGVRGVYCVKGRYKAKIDSFLSAPMTHWQKQLLPERKRKKC